MRPPLHLSTSLSLPLPTPLQSAIQIGQTSHSPLSCKVLGPSGNDNHIIKPPIATIGVIGGMSATSTVYFLERLVLWSDASCLPFIVFGDPILAGSTKAQVIENIGQKTKFLEHLGAKCIVIPCHQSLLWHPEVSERCSLPVLPIGESVVSELRASRLRPLEAGSRNPRIGVLAISSSPSANFYQEKLRSEGYEVVFPDKQTADQILRPAIQCAKTDKEGAKMLLIICINILLAVRGAKKVILACDELQGLIPRNDPLLRRCLNPLDCLATSTIKWANKFIKI